MMDLCDIFYPTEQGYITGERGVQIEQGSDDGPMWQIYPTEQGYITGERGGQIEKGSALGLSEDCP
jgi:hypothetical protein